MVRIDANLRGALFGLGQSFVDEGPNFGPSPSALSLGIFGSGQNLSNSIFGGPLNSRNFLFFGPIGQLTAGLLGSGAQSSGLGLQAQAAPQLASGLNVYGNPERFGQNAGVPNLMNPIQVMPPSVGAQPQAQTVPSTPASTINFRSKKPDEDKNAEKAKNKPRITPEQEEETKKALGEKGYEPTGEADVILEKARATADADPEKFKAMMKKVPAKALIIPEDERVRMSLAEITAKEEEHHREYPKKLAAWYARYVQHITDAAALTAAVDAAATSPSASDAFVGVKFAGKVDENGYEVYSVGEREGSAAGTALGAATELYRKDGQWFKKDGSNYRVLTIAAYKRDKGRIYFVEAPRVPVEGTQDVPEFFKNMDIARAALDKGKIDAKAERDAIRKARKEAFERKWSEAVPGALRSKLQYEYNPDKNVVDIKFDEKDAEALAIAFSELADSPALPATVWPRVLKTPFNDAFAVLPRFEQYLDPIENPKIRFNGRNEARVDADSFGQVKAKALAIPRSLTFVETNLGTKESKAAIKAEVKRLVEKAIGDRKIPRATKVDLGSVTLSDKMGNKDFEAVIAELGIDSTTRFAGVEIIYKIKDQSSREEAIFKKMFSSALSSKLRQEFTLKNYDAGANVFEFNYDSKKIDELAGAFAGGEINKARFNAALAWMASVKKQDLSKARFRVNGHTSESFGADPFTAIRGAVYKYPIVVKSFNERMRQWEDATVEQAKVREYEAAHLKKAEEGHRTEEAEYNGFAKKIEAAEEQERKAKQEKEIAKRIGEQLAQQRKTREEGEKRARAELETKEAEAKAALKVAEREEQSALEAAFKDLENEPDSPVAQAMAAGRLIAAEQAEVRQKVAGAEVARVDALRAATEAQNEVGKKEDEIAATGIRIRELSGTVTQLTRSLPSAVNRASAAETAAKRADVVAVAAQRAAAKPPAPAMPRGRPAPAELKAKADTANAKAINERRKALEARARADALTAQRKRVAEERRKAEKARLKQQKELAERKRAEKKAWADAEAARRRKEAAEANAKKEQEKLEREKQAATEKAEEARRKQAKAEADKAKKEEDDRRKAEEGRKAREKLEGAARAAAEAEARKREQEAQAQRTRESAVESARRAEFEAAMVRGEPNDTMLSAKIPLVKDSGGRVIEMADLVLPPSVKSEFDKAWPGMRIPSRTSQDLLDAVAKQAMAEVRGKWGLEPRAKEGLSLLDILSEKKGKCTDFSAYLYALFMYAKQKDAERGDKALLADIKVDFAQVYQAGHEEHVCVRVQSGGREMFYDLASPKKVGGREHPRQDKRQSVSSDLRTFYAIRLTNRAVDLYEEYRQLTDKKMLTADEQLHGMSSARLAKIKEKKDAIIAVLGRARSLAPNDTAVMMKLARLETTIADVFRYTFQSANTNRLDKNFVNEMKYAALRCGVAALEHLEAAKKGNKIVVDFYKSRKNYRQIEQDVRELWRKIKRAISGGDYDAALSSIGKNKAYVDGILGGLG